MVGDDEALMLSGFRRVLNAAPDIDVVATAGRCRGGRRRTARDSRRRADTEIGAAVALGAGIVKDRVSAILGKLGVVGRVRAALLAQRAGLLDGRQRSAEAGR
jgi:DNA-binding NarL/FixJ family response regulator